LRHPLPAHLKTLKNWYNVKRHFFINRINMTDLLVDGNVAQGEVTGSPYLVNSTSVATTFNAVKLQNGGYIKITVPCIFTSITFTKETGGTSTTQYDIEIVGANGQNGENGIAGASYNPSQAASGSSAKCDAAGGACAQYGRGGASGAQGNPGGDAVEFQSITNGSPAPNVELNLGTLSGSVSVLNVGGTGGIGGTGGKGGQGQQGGNGGSYKKCGAVYCAGGSGGSGGTGGTGGKGGNGGDGGNGGSVTINYTPSSGADGLIPYPKPAGGGNAGDGGSGGDGGAGGSGGGHGGSGGEPGAQGSTGSMGNSGNAGNVGSFVIGLIRD